MKSDKKKEDRRIVNDNDLEIIGRFAEEAGRGQQQVQRRRENVLRYGGHAFFLILDNNNNDDDDDDGNNGDARLMASD